MGFKLNIGKDGGGGTSGFSLKQSLNMIKAKGMSSQMVGTDVMKDGYYNTVNESGAGSPALQADRGGKGTFDEGDYTYRTDGDGNKVQVGIVDRGGTRKTTKQGQAAAQAFLNNTTFKNKEGEETTPQYGPGGKYHDQVTNYTGGDLKDGKGYKMADGTRVLKSNTHAGEYKKGYAAMLKEKAAFDRNKKSIIDGFKKSANAREESIMTPEEEKRAGRD